MTLIKAANLDIYTWKESRYISFTYRPADGLVRAANRPSIEKAIEYFCYKQYRVDWKNSNTAQGILQVVIPDHLEADQEELLLTSSLEDMVATSLVAREKAKSSLLLLNVDNSTGEVIKEKYLSDTMGRINKSANKTREDIAEWFNKYNLELARPDTPLISVSTKAKKTIIDEGKGLVWKLFEQGKLRKLTKEEYEAKIKSSTKD
tara:strand:- start:2635 stop:3249 length:615 start_codon:yes stop_codon:yes gene_type:complete